MKNPDAIALAYGKFIQPLHAIFMVKKVFVGTLAHEKLFTQKFNL